MPLTPAKTTQTHSGLMLPTASQRLQQEVGLQLEEGDLLLQQFPAVDRPSLFNPGNIFDALELVITGSGDESIFGDNQSVNSAFSGTGIVQQLANRMYPTIDRSNLQFYHQFHFGENVPRIPSALNNTTSFNAYAFIRETSLKDDPVIQQMVINRAFDHVTSHEQMMQKIFEGQQFMQDLDVIDRASGWQMTQAIAWQMGAEILATWPLGGAGILNKLTSAKNAMQAMRAIGITGAVGGAGNLTFEEIMNELQPLSEQRGPGNEIAATVFGVAMGAGLSSVLLGTKYGLGSVISTRRAKQWRKMLVRVTDDTQIKMQTVDPDDPRVRTAERTTVGAEIDASIRQLRRLLDNPIEETPMIAVLKGNAEVDALLAQVRKKYDAANAQFQDVPHPEQQFYDAVRTVQEILNHPAMLAEATPADFDANHFDTIFNQVTKRYADAQSLVNPAGRLARSTLGKLSDAYRTISGSAQTLLRGNAEDPLNFPAGAHAEHIKGIFEQTKYDVRRLVDSAYRAIRQRDGDSDSFVYDGQVIPSRRHGREFAEAVIDYRHRLKDQADGYDVDIPDTVDDAIKEANQALTDHFGRMLDHMELEGMLDIGPRALQRSLARMTVTRNKLQNAYARRRRIIGERQGQISDVIDDADDPFGGAGLAAEQAAEDAAETANIATLQALDSHIAGILPEGQPTTAGGNVLQFVYDLIGVPPPKEGGDPLVRIGLIRLRQDRNLTVKLNDAETLKDLSRTIFKQNMETRGIDPEAALGGTSNLTEAGVADEIARATRQAQGILDSLDDALPQFELQNAADVPASAQADADAARPLMSAAAANRVLDELDNPDLLHIRTAERIMEGKGGAAMEGVGSGASSTDNLAEHGGSFWMSQAEWDDLTGLQQQQMRNKGVAGGSDEMAQAVRDDIGDVLYDQVMDELFTTKAQRREKMIHFILNSDTDDVSEEMREAAEVLGWFTAEERRDLRRIDSQIRKLETEDAVFSDNHNVLKRQLQSMEFYLPRAFNVGQIMANPTGFLPLMAQALRSADDRGTDGFDGRNVLADLVESVDRTTGGQARRELRILKGIPDLDDQGKPLEVPDSALVEGLTEGELPASIKNIYQDALGPYYDRLAQSVFDTLTGPKERHGIAEGLTANPVMRRVLAISETELNDAGFMVRDMDRILDRYHMAVSGQLSVRKAIRLNPEMWAGVTLRNGDPVIDGRSLKSHLKEITNAMTTVAARVDADNPDQKKLLPLATRLGKQVDTTFGWPLDMIEGRNPIATPSNAYAGWATLGRMALNLSYTNKLGSVAYAMINDMAPVAMFMMMHPIRGGHLLSRTIRDLDGLSTREARSLGLQLEGERARNLSDTMHADDHMNMPRGPVLDALAAGERVSRRASDFVSKYSLMNWITNVSKRLSGAIAMDTAMDVSRRMIRAQALMAADKSLTLPAALRKAGLPQRHTAALVNSFGLNVERAKVFHRKIYDHGLMRNGDRINTRMSFDEYLASNEQVIANVPEWTFHSDVERDMLDLVTSNVSGHVHRNMIVTPGAFDRPLINFRILGQMFNQFQTFGMGFVNQRLAPMAQMPFQMQSGYFMSYMFLGAISDALSNAASGRRSFTETADLWADNPMGMSYRAWERSGLIGILGRFSAIGNAMRLPYSPDQAINQTGTAASAHVQPGRALTLAGPVFMDMDRMFRVLSDVFGGNLRRATAYNAWKLGPAQNILWLRLIQQIAGPEFPVTPEALMHRQFEAQSDGPRI